LSNFLQQVLHIFHLVNVKEFFVQIQHRGYFRHAVVGHRRDLLEILLPYRWHLRFLIFSVHYLHVCRFLQRLHQSLNLRNLLQLLNDLWLWIQNLIY